MSAFGVRRLCGYIAFWGFVVVRGSLSGGIRRLAGFVVVRGIGHEAVGMCEAGSGVRRMVIVERSSERTSKTTRLHASCSLRLTRLGKVRDRRNSLSVQVLTRATLIRWILQPSNNVRRVGEVNDLPSSYKPKGVPHEDQDKNQSGFGSAHRTQWIVEKLRGHCVAG